MENKEKIAFIIFLSLILIFGIISSTLIRNNFYNGWDEGSRQSVNLIVERAMEKGYVDIYDPISNQSITLIEYNQSMELCYDILEGIYND